MPYGTALTETKTIFAGVAASRACRGSGDVNDPVGRFGNETTARRNVSLGVE